MYKIKKRKSIERNGVLIMADCRQKKAEWLEKHCFNEQETTFIYFPSDSYDVKENLKDAGFRFSKELLWHIANIPEGYEEKVVEIALRDIAVVTAWGEGVYRPDVKSIVEDLVKAARPVEISTSEWIGEEKDRIYDYPVVLKSVRGMDTRYGYTQLVKFEDIDGNELNWWTAVEIKAEVGSDVLLTGTVKKLDEYQGKKITVMTRCKIKEA